MKKVFAFIFTMLLSPISLSSQTDCMYGEYHDLITESYDDIYLKEHQNALDKYVLAFTKVEVPFCSDLLKAFNLAVRQGDDLQAKEIAVKLAKGGIPLEYFENFIDTSWYADFEFHFEEYAAHHKAFFDLALKSKILALRVQDSVYNVCFHQWRRGEIDMSLNELVEGAQSIIQELEKLIDTHGFPSQKRMGYFYNHQGISYNPLSIILRHIYQNGVSLYQDDFENLLCEGDLSFIDGVSLHGVRGFGNNTGVENEMKITYAKFGK